MLHGLREPDHGCDCSCEDKNEEKVSAKIPEWFKPGDLPMFLEVEET